MTGSVEESTPVQHYPFAFGDYLEDDNNAVDADSAAANVVKALTALLGGEIVPWGSEAGRHRSATDVRLAKFATVEQTCSLVWVGHGESNDIDASVTVPAIGVEDAQTDTRLRPADLADYLADQSARRRGAVGDAWTLVLVEACGAARFVELTGAELARRGGVRAVALVGFGDPAGRGHLGTAASVVREVVSSLTSNDTEVRVTTLLHEIERRLGADHGYVLPLRLAGHRVRRPSLPLTATLDIYTRLEPVLRSLSEAERSHFVRKGMGADFGELTWSFVGRREERQVIAKHLNTGSGLLVVTGPAGSGKSAVLGNLLLRSHEELRRLLTEERLLETDPVTDLERCLTVDKVLHLTGMTHDEVATALADACDVDLEARTATSKSSSEDGDRSGGLQETSMSYEEVIAALVVAEGEESATSSEAITPGGDLVRQLLMTVRALPQPPRIMVDALDESRDPRAIARLLRELADAGACLVVGTRASTREGLDHATEKRELLDELGVDVANTVTVGRDPEALAMYVNLAFSREGAPEWIRNAVIASIEQPTADLAFGRERQFLFVRLLVHELLAQERAGSHLRPAVDDLVGGTHRTVFAAAMERLRWQDPAAAALLGALAHARGTGLPRLGGIWELVTSGVSGQPMMPDAVDDALPLLAPYVMLDAENGRGVYRLAHRTFTEHFESIWGDEWADRELKAVHTLVAAVGEKLVDATDYELDPYLVAHLAAHAAAAGETGWRLLVEKEALLDLVDPMSVAAEAMRFPGRILPEIAAIMVGAHLLTESEPANRRGVRELTGASVGASFRAPADGTAPTWCVRMAARTYQHPHRTLSGHQPVASGVTSFTTSEGARLASCGADGVVRIWDPSNGIQIGESLVGHVAVGGKRSLFGDGVIRVSSFVTADGVRLASCGADGAVRIWDPARGVQVGRLVGHSGRVWDVMSFLTTEGVRLASCGNDTVRIWDALSFEQVGAPLTGHNARIVGLTSFMAAEGVRLVSCSDDRTVRIWDPLGHTQVGDPLTGHNGGVCGVEAFSEAGGAVRLATCSADGTVRIWDPEACVEAGEALIGHTGSVRQVTSFVAAEGVRLATGSDDRTVRVWDPLRGVQVGVPLAGHTGPVCGVTSFVTAVGAVRLATAGEDGTVRVWDPVSGVLAREPLTGHTDWVVGLARFMTDRLLVTCSDDGTVRVWDTLRGVTVGQPFVGRSGGLFDVDSFLAPEGVRVATAGGDGTVRVWDPMTGVQVRDPLAGHRGSVRGISSFVTAEGVRLATAGEDGSVLIWDPIRGVQVGEPLTGHMGWVSGVASFAPAPGVVHLASAGKDGTVRIWDLAHSQQLKIIPIGPEGDLRGVTALTTPKGIRLATYGRDRSVGIWDPGSGALRYVVRLQHDLRSIASLGGDLVVGLNDGWARIVLPQDRI